MPVREAIRPVTVKRISFCRLTRMPANRAASSLAPVAKTERPKGVACRAITAITSRTRKGMKACGTKLSPIRPAAKSRYWVGKSVTASEPRTICAMPR